MLPHKQQSAFKATLHRSHHSIHAIPGLCSPPSPSPLWVLWSACACYIVPALQQRAELLCNPCILGGPQAKLLHCVGTACILRTQRLGYSPKNTCHLTGCTAKQQSPHENDEITFNLVLHCPYEQTTQPCEVRLLRVFRCPWLHSWRRR